jgi:outer membrane protein assembly factor BamB
MKTSRKSMIVALMFGTLIGYANGTNALVVKNNASTFTVKLNDVKKGNRIYVKNTKGRTVLSKTIQQNGDYLKSIDVSSLKDGDYYIEIDKDFEILISSIKISNGTVFSEGKNSQTIYKPVFRTEANRVFISKIAFDSKVLNVKIYFEGTLILSESVEGEKVLNRIYNLSKDVKGNYKVILKSNDRTYTHTFSL